MALKATVVKAVLQISDMDRHYYAEHALTLAQHPSETELRMMVRLLAFAMFASEQLSFTKGLCEDDEPELWQKSLADEIELWIDLGNPDEKRLKKASTRAKKAVLFSYGDRATEVWWQGLQNKVSRLSNLQVIHLDDTATAGLAGMAARGMQLNVTIQDGEIWLSDSAQSLQIVPKFLQ